jgi:hypothetical protein
MIRFHMIISGFTWLRLGYIRARSLIMYPYVFVAGPNKHDLFPCVNDQRKFQQSSSSVMNTPCPLSETTISDTVASTAGARNRSVLV